ncbi:MAG: MFS transporter, partial [Paenibacillus sp.]|uniref:MFS transporter n=1 Tax=Paenibacillus sp. TaxID=58172 RepID=UPI0029000D10
DLVSMVYSTAGFGGLLFGFSNAGNKGWGSAEVLACLVVGGIFLILFCRRQLTSPAPLMNLRVFQDKMYTVTTVISILIMMVMYADMILLPIYLQTSRGFSVLETGLLLLPGALINALLSPVSGRLLDKFGIKPIAIIGLLFTIPAIWGVTHLTEWTPYSYLVVRTIILRIGLSFLTMPLNTAGLNALPKHMNAHGSAVTNTVRQVAGAIGTALVVTIYTARTKLHATALVESGQALSKAQLKEMSTILGTNDAYFCMAVLSVLILAVTIFMPNRKGEAGPQGTKEAAKQPVKES